MAPQSLPAGAGDAGRGPERFAAVPLKPGSSLTAPALETIRQRSEEVREAYMKMMELMHARDEAIVRAIDVAGASHRQAARAAGLSTARIESILAND